MTSSFDVYGFGFSLVDVSVKLQDRHFDQFSLEQTELADVSFSQRREMVETLGTNDESLTFTSGGCAANSLTTLARLGGSAMIGSKVGKDDYGTGYQGELSDLRISFDESFMIEEATGLAIILVDKAGERYIKADMGANLKFTPNDVSTAGVQSSTWVHVIGDMLIPPDGEASVKRIYALARQHGTKIAFSLGNRFTVRKLTEQARWACENADLVFGNALEAGILTDCSDGAEASFLALDGIAPNVVVTDGSNGAYISFDGVQSLVPTIKADVLSATGAGDAFAGAIMYGLTHGITPEQSAVGASALGAKVVQQMAARVPDGAKAIWDEAVEG